MDHASLQNVHQDAHARVVMESKNYSRQVSPDATLSTASRTVAASEACSQGRCGASPAWEVQ